MIHILLLILKILGFVLLGILGLVLLILLLLLYAPIHYSIIGIDEEELDFEIKFSYLLNFFLGSYKINKERKDFSLYSLWGLCRLKSRKKKEDYSKDFYPDEEDDEVENEEEDFEDDDQFDEETSDDDFDEVKDTLSSKTVKKKKKKKQSFTDKLNTIKEDYLNEANKRAVGYLLKQVVYLLKKYLPRRAKGDLYFGTTEPSTTGEILGVLSLLPFMYQKGLFVHPDFESEAFYFHGKLKAKGFIQLYALVLAFIRLLINKDTRKLFKLFKKK